MRSIALLNAESGTLRTTDIDAYRRRMEELFAEAGHSLSCRVVSGREVASALEAAFGEDGSEAVIVAGGDGTLSSAAALAWKTGKPMGVVPAGTMNLFARSLGMPMEIVAAAAALAGAKVAKSDIATANGRPFLHHFSVGFQPRLVQLREQRPYRSRIGKIGASILAALDTIRRPPSFPAELEIDGRRRSHRLSSLAVSNNPYGEGHLPYADDLGTGTLGIYHARPASNAANARMLADLALGSWSANPDITMETGRKVVLTFPKRHSRARAVVDGELVELEDRIEIENLPGQLNVLRPPQ